MILLKHLAREFDIDPYKLRQMLRKQFPEPRGEGYRSWRWDNADNSELVRIRAYLKGLKNA